MVYINIIRYGAAGNPHSLSEALKETVASEIAQINKGVGLYFTLVGIYALVSGLWGSFVWPLPSSYNIVLVDPWPVFGVASMIIGLALWFGVNPRYIAVPLAPLGIPIVTYGVVIWLRGMTTEPAIAGLMYFLVGVSALLAPLALSRAGYSKAMGWIAIALLIVAALIALFIGVNAAYAHTAGWRAWSPWYGAVNVTAR